MVIFDLDGVLVDLDSSWQCIHRAFNRDNEENFQRYQREEIDYHEFMRSDIALWGRVNIEQIKRILDKVPLMATARKTINELKKKGYKTAIVSSGISILADRVKEMLNIDHSYANELLVDDEGWLTGEGRGIVELSSKDLILKRLAKEEGVPIKQCAVIGDSEYDVSLFREAGFSVAFNTENKVVQGAADLVIEDKDLCKILPWLNSKKLVKAKFTLAYKSEKEARVIVDSISPDNTNQPFDLSIRAWNEGKNIKIKILCIKTGTMIATLNDLFSCMHVAENVIRATKFTLNKTFK